MPLKDPSFTIGIEEEYLLVDRTTRELVSEPPADVLEQCRARTDDLVRPEFLTSQIEVGTSICEKMGLQNGQGCLDQVAFGLSITIRTKGEYI